MSPFKPELKMKSRPPHHFGFTLIFLFVSMLACTANCARDETGANSLFPTNLTGTAIIATPTANSVSAVVAVTASPTFAGIELAGHLGGNQIRAMPT